MIKDKDGSPLKNILDLKKLEDILAPVEAEEMKYAEKLRRTRVLPNQEVQESLTDPEKDVEKRIFPFTRTSRRIKFDPPSKFWCRMLNVDVLIFDIHLIIELTFHI